jgi:hypothetical protein
LLLQNCVCCWVEAVPQQRQDSCFVYQMQSVGYRLAGIDVLAGLEAY